MVYKSYCLCFGKEQVSIFVTPETCESEIHFHHKHDAYGAEASCSADECHDPKNHSDECGCNVPEAIFFKLQNQITNEEVKFVKVLPLEFFVAEFAVFAELLDESAFLIKEKPYSNSPPIISSSLDFLVQIQQLKIPLIA